MAFIFSPHFGWDGINFLPNSCYVLDLVTEKNWQCWSFQLLLWNQGLLSSLPYSALEQVCRSWEGEQTDRKPSWPMEIFHTIDIKHPF